MKKNQTTKSVRYTKTAKNILSVAEKFVLLRRSNQVSGIRTAGESCRLFLCLHIIKWQALRLVVCGSSNARMDMLTYPEQHHRPFLFNVQKDKQ